MSELLLFIKKATFYFVFLIFVIVGLIIVASRDTGSFLSLLEGLILTIILGFFGIGSMLYLENSIEKDKRI